LFIGLLLGRTATLIHSQEILTPLPLHQVGPVIQYLHADEIVLISTANKGAIANVMFVMYVINTHGHTLFIRDCGVTTVALL
jgi:hypothetical protein